jgi:uncharacterized membrane protein YeaQ/YmgE (transglycosylase-associated protein family)
MELLIILWLFCGFACAGIANSKDRGILRWFFLGLLGGLLSLFIIALLSSRKDLRTATAIAIANGEIASPETHVRCPDCQELVRKEARKCKHCGSALAPQ